MEKFPDLAEEKEARQKELRFRDRDAQQQRVSGFAFPGSTWLDPAFDTWMLYLYLATVFTYEEPANKLTFPLA